MALPQPLEAEFFCQTCRTPFANGYDLDENDRCLACRESLVTFDAAYSFGSYEGPLQKLIQLFKYGKVESLACPLSKLLLKGLPFGENFDAVLPMPMHWRKQWDRGFNQAELLAEPVARRFGRKLSRNLRRIRYTEAQATLGEAERRKNLKDSFAVKNAADVAGQRLLLIDDVFTTGATLRAAAAVLKSSGAARVTALTLARVDHRIMPGLDRQRLKAAGRGRGFETSSAPSTTGERITQTVGTGAK